MDHISVGTELPLGENRRLLIVGFCGRAKSGKDSAVRAIEEALTSQGVKCEIRAFADPIREIGRIFDFPEECLTNQALKESWLHPYLSVTPRKFMQQVGSEMFRNVLDKDVWVKFMMNKIDEFDKDLRESSTRKLMESTAPSLWSPKGVVLITDVRFPNEAEAIVERGGHIIKIDRGSGPDSDGEWRNHESEKYVDELSVSTTFVNDASSLLHWKGKAVSMFAEWAKSKGIYFDESWWYNIQPV
jgi:hypothetical protein